MGLDPLGLRTVTVTLYYHWTVLKATDAMKEEVNRIIQDCVQRCGCHDKQKQPKHQVVLQWIEVKERPENKELGWKGGGMFHRNPDGYSAYSHDDYSGGGMAQSGGSAFGINEANVQEKAKLVGEPLDKCVACAVAHELALHLIGGSIGHYHEEGFIDATSGLVGGKLSDKACAKFCDQMDIDK